LAADIWIGSGIVGYRCLNRQRHSLSADFWIGNDKVFCCRFWIRQWHNFDADFWIGSDSFYCRFLNRQRQCKT
jgi:hypothetical protein